jgi:hypothetical protein
MLDPSVAYMAGWNGEAGHSKRRTLQLQAPYYPGPFRHWLCL